MSTPDIQVGDELVITCLGPNNPGTVRSVIGKDFLLSFEKSELSNTGWFSLSEIDHEATRQLKALNKELDVLRGTGKTQEDSGPLSTQVGGDHYKDSAVQPVEFITANNLTFLEGCVVKRVARHRKKNGAEDIRKAIHELEMILELEYSI